MDAKENNHLSIVVGQYVEIMWIEAAKMILFFFFVFHLSLSLSLSVNLSMLTIAAFRCQPKKNTHTPMHI